MEGSNLLEHKPVRFSKGVGPLLLGMCGDSHRRLGFNLTAVHIRFGVAKATLGEVLRAIAFPLLCISIPSVIHTSCYHVQVQRLQYYGTVPLHCCN